MIRRRLSQLPFLCLLPAVLLQVVSLNAAPLHDEVMVKSEIATAISGEWVVPERSIWAGEVFDLELRWQLDWPSFNFIEDDLKWTTASLVIDPWSKPATVVPEPGLSTGYVSVTTHAMAQNPGALVLGPAQQKFNLLLGKSGSSGVPRSASSELIESAEGQLNVMDLPPAPTKFSGAVGSFELTSEVSAAEVAVGDTLTWTLNLSGRGNWPMRPALPARRLPEEFSMLEPAALRQISNTSLFEGGLEETLLLSPTKVGNYLLPAIQMEIFDPKSGRYVSLTAPARSVIVTPATGWPLDEQPESTAPSWQTISGAGSTWVPPADSRWHMLLLLPLIALLLFWLVLSLLHAWAADPGRRPRGAQIQLRRLMPAIDASADARQLGDRLRLWQQLVAQRFDISTAAPTPVDLIANPEWAMLWGGADTVLYGEATSLTSDWTKRANLLLENLPLPTRFKPTEALRRRNLMARSCATTLVLCLTSALFAATAPEQETLNTIQGNNWIASHNYAISLLEEQRPNKAAAYAAAAWLRSPADDRAYSLWMQTAQSSSVPEDGVPQPTHAVGVALLGLSPAIWRWVAVASIWLLALTAGVALARRFGRTDVSSRTLMISVVLGGCGAMVSFGLLGQYGLAASPDSVMVWRESIARSLPIEQPADSQAPILPAGTLARSDKFLLGWRLLRLADGNSVWVRQSDMVWLWHDNPTSYPDYAKEHLSPASKKF